VGALAVQDDRLALSMRHLADAERRVARQKLLIAKMEADVSSATFT
jgi:hypothetical protein